MNSKVGKNDFDKYLAEARNWETDKVITAEKSKRTAWRVASAASILALVAVGGLSIIGPMKSVQPYVIRVDNSTGIVDVASALKDSKTNYDEAINKYFTQLYIRYREGYSRELAEEYYSNVGIMSAGLEQQKYFAWFNPANPQSPLNVYGQSAKVKVSIKSTSFIKPTVALVRYTKAIERGTDKPQITHWAATIIFKYSGAPMSEKNRAINPLGFQVTEYRNDPDAPPSENAPAYSGNTPATPRPSGVTVFPAQAALATATIPAPAPAVPAIQPEH